MTIFEINENMRAVLEDGFAIDKETGEIFEDIEALQMAREEKIENTVDFYKELLATADAQKKYAEEMEQKAKATKNKAEQIKALLMMATQGEKFKTAKCSISYRKSVKCVATNENLIPEEYFRVKTTREVDKEALKKKMQEGFVCEGAELVENTSIVIK